MANNKKISNTQEEVQASVSTIYAELLKKRKVQREEKEAKRLKEKEEKKRKKEEKEQEESKLSKKEKRESELASWESVIIGLTGDDLEYNDSDKKSKKKKYRKWIDEETDTDIKTVKPKKKKKKNYQKEFEPELNMLKSIVADQNKFTADLQKRFLNAAGPANKDAAPLNKTLVDLAGQVNSSRQNSLGLLREIGTLKKNIAELYFKQLKADMDGNATGFNTQDLGLLGSSVASSMFADNIAMSTPVEPIQGGEFQNQQSSSPVFNASATAVSNNQQEVETPIAESFDPSTWDGPSLGSNNSVVYENIPHSIVVEWHKDKNMARFKAVRNDNGEELTDCPVPTSDPSKLKFNEKDLTVKGEFDETYKLEIL